MKSLQAKNITLNVNNCVKNLYFIKLNYSETALTFPAKKSQANLVPMNRPTMRNHKNKNIICMRRFEILIA